MIDASKTRLHKHFVLLKDRLSSKVDLPVNGVCTMMQHTRSTRISARPLHSQRSNGKTMKMQLTVLTTPTSGSSGIELVSSERCNLIIIIPSRGRRSSKVVGWNEEEAMLPSSITRLHGAFICSSFRKQEQRSSQPQHDSSHYSSALLLWHRRRRFRSLATQS